MSFWMKCKIYNVWTFLLLYHSKYYASPWMTFKIISPYCWISNSDITDISCVKPHINIKLTLSFCIACWKHAFVNWTWMLMGLQNMELLDPYTKTIFQIYVSKLLHIKFKQTYLVVLYVIHAHYFALKYTFAFMCMYECTWRQRNETCGSKHAWWDCDTS